MAEQLLRGGVHDRDQAVEIEDHDTGRRHAQNVTQEVMLLLQAGPLVAQVVDHLVVQRDQLVNLRLPDFANARCEILVLDQLDAGARKAQVQEQISHEADADEKRTDENHFNGK